MNIGFIGLGVQGKHLALNVVRAGFPLTVFDPRSEPLAELTEAGASSANSPRGVGLASELIAICVRDDQQVLDCVLGPNGVLSGASAGKILVLHSTISHETVMRVAAEAGRVGVHVLDAPVSGGERGAMARTMSYMVGGGDDVIDRALPFMNASGDKITRTGAVGSATYAKIVHQLIICVNMMAAQEGMKLGVAAGLSPEILTKIVREGGAQSRMADNWFQLSLRPHAVSVFDKDLGLCLDLAKTLGLATPAAELARSRIDEIVP